MYNREAMPLNESLFVLFSMKEDTSSLNIVFTNKSKHIQGVTDVKGHNMQRQQSFVMLLLCVSSRFEPVSKHNRNDKCWFAGSSLPPMFIMSLSYISSLFAILVSWLNKHSEVSMVLLHKVL